MAALILPRRFTQQPQSVVGVNWDNPLSKGLQLLFTGTHEIVNNAALYSATDFDQPSFTKNAYYGNGVAQFIDKTKLYRSRYAAGQPFTVMSIATIMSGNATGLGSQFFDANFVSTNDRQGFNLISSPDSNAYFNMYANASTTALAVSISPHTAGTVLMIIGRFNGESSSIHARTNNNSVVSTSGSLSNFVQVTEANRLIVVGRNASGNSNSAMHFAANWNRALTDSEITRLLTKGEIFSLYKPRKHILYFDAPSFPTLSSLAVSNITSSGARLTAN